MGLALNNIKDIEANTDMIIFQATNEEEFIYEYDYGSTDVLDLEKSQRRILRSIISDVYFVSGHYKALVETVFGRDEVNGGGGRKRTKRILVLVSECMKLSRNKFFHLISVVWLIPRETSALFLSLGTLFTTHSTPVYIRLMREFMPRLLLSLNIFLEVVLM